NDKVISICQLQKLYHTCQLAKNLNLQLDLKKQRNFRHYLQVIIDNESDEEDEIGNVDTMCKVINEWIEMLDDEESIEAIKSLNDLLTKIILHTKNQMQIVVGNFVQY
ncbi:34048_t:CDS:1, partial [Gigaspora margarita]